MASVEERNTKLMELYAEISQSSCGNVVCFLGINKKFKLSGKLGKEPTLIISQNPSYYRSSNSSSVWGGLDKFNSKELYEALEKVYITNVMKCSFYHNIVPNNSMELFGRCAGKFLKKEIGIIQPEKTIFLGRYAAEFNSLVITGKKFYFFHPQYALRIGEGEKYVEDLISVINNK